MPPGGPATLRCHEVVTCDDVTERDNDNVSLMARSSGHPRTNIARESGLGPLINI